MSCCRQVALSTSGHLPHPGLDPLWSWSFDKDPPGLWPQASCRQPWVQPVVHSGLDEAWEKEQGIVLSQGSMASSGFDPTQRKNLASSWQSGLWQTPAIKWRSLFCCSTKRKHSAEAAFPQATLTYSLWWLDRGGHEKENFNGLLMTKNGDSEMSPYKFYWHNTTCQGG